MNIVPLIARCLSILAVVGMLAVQTSGPVAAKAVASSNVGASTATMAIDGMAMATARLDTCPGSDQAPADCGKACPWAILCMASCVDLIRLPELAAAASHRVGSRMPTDDPIVPPWSDGPPARPPRT